MFGQGVIVRHVDCEFEFEPPIIRTKQVEIIKDIKLNQPFHHGIDIFLPLKSVPRNERVTNV